MTTARAADHTAATAATALSYRDEAVRIERCSRGIPTVTAGSALGLAFGQGFATAADRPRQLRADYLRMRGIAAQKLHGCPSGGDAANGYGNATMPSPEEASDALLDRVVNAVGLTRIAQACLRRASPEAQAFSAAYAAGVNAYQSGVSGGGGRTGSAQSGPLHPPIPEWEPWAPVGFFLLAHLLFGAYPETLWREKALAALGPDLAAAFTHEPILAAGSNAWFLPAHLTQSGRPILCADPHRLLECPGPYQQVRLRAPGIRVDGLAFPGMPGTPHFGQTPSVAWVVTNAMADSQPLVRQPAGTQQPGAQPAPEDGSRFPVVAHWDGEDLGLAWSANRVGDGGLGTSLSLLRASSVGDVHGAFAEWTDPVNDVLAADVAGDAARFTAGRVPALSPAQRSRPLRAEELRAAGWESFPVRPLRAPEAAANERKRDEPLLGFTYCPDQRARRIRELIGAATARGPVSLSDAAAIAMDTYDEGLHRLVRVLFAQGTCPGGGEDAAAEAFAVRLASWDGHFAAESTLASDVARWRHQLVHLIAQLPCFSPLFAPDAGPEPVGGDLFRPWLDPQVRIGMALVPLCTALGKSGVDVRSLAWEAVRMAVAELIPQGASAGGTEELRPQVAGVVPASASAAGAPALASPVSPQPGATPPESPPWGEIHVAEPLVARGTDDCVARGTQDAGSTDNPGNPDGHVAPGLRSGTPPPQAPSPVQEQGSQGPSPASATPGIRDGLRYAPPAVGVGGDTQAVLSTGSVPGSSNGCLRAPVARVAWDVGAPEHSQWVVPWGVGAEDYPIRRCDQTRRWAEGSLIPVIPDGGAGAAEESAPGRSTGP